MNRPVTARPHPPAVSQQVSEETGRNLVLNYLQLTYISCEINLEPCPPTNVWAILECETHSATISWQQSDLATGYVAYFENQSGHDTLCTGTQADSQCVVSGLVCDTVYSVWVKALGLQYNSSDSTIITLTAGRTNKQHAHVT